IFSAYTEKYTVEVSTCLDDKMRVRLQGRKVTPQVYLRQGPFLSWSGFEAVCQDFSIATTTAAIGVMSRTKAAGVTGSASSPHHHHHNNNNNNINSINHSRHSTQGALPSDHQRPPRTSPSFLAVKGACRPDSDTTGVLSTQTPSGSLLSGVQACIAFVSACTQGFAVASFPSDDGGSGNSDAGGGSVKKLPSQIYRGDSTDKGGKRTSDNEDDAAYWRSMERVVMSDCTLQDANSSASGLGLSFRQFVDALVRCGLMGFSAERAAAGVPVAQRAHAIFIRQMKLLDGQHVDAKVM
ncbi:unnamed protein product, partial [Pylaiella littoralis]